MIGRSIAHYTILEKLGEGGMGIVYKARDTHLNRFVAIKVLPPQSVSDPKRKRRFVQEARAASALNHPNIITIYDITQEGGVDFISMEYVAGDTLSRLIARRALPLHEALGYAAQMAGALVAAHRAGIIHRDLKPSNVMVTRDGLVKVLDFGLAKLAETGAPREDEATRTLQQETEKGTVVGTVAYMSPEQAEGKPVDSRSDIFSFGVVLYEMITGRRAFERRSRLATLSAILRDEPASLDPSVPRELAKIIARCLNKDPNRRFQDIGDIKVALEEMRVESTGKTAKARTVARRRWLQSAAAVAVLLMALSWRAGLLRQWLYGRTTTGRIESLAVLPLANFSRDPAQEYFADGMTEALIADLAQVGSLRVISRTSVMQFKETRKALPDIGRQLKVDAVVEGSVVHAGNRVRITAQLIEAATDRHLWAETYERDLADVLALQGEVARAIADQIRVRLTPGEHARLAQGRPVKPEAYEYYLRGKQLGWSKAETGTAIGMLERAVEIDPGFAAAYADLARFYVAMFFYFEPQEQGQWEPKARAAVDRALELDPGLAEAYIARSELICTPSTHFPWEKAIRDLRQALALKPNSSEAHADLAEAYVHVGLLEEAQDHLRRVREIDPAHGADPVMEMLALTGLGRYEEALSMWQTTPQRGVWSRAFTAGLLIELGRLKEARAQLNELHDEKVEFPGGVINGLQALLLAAERKDSEAEQQIRLAAENKGFGHFHHTAFLIACAYSRMNRLQQSIAWLEQTADQGFPCYPAFEHDPSLEPLRKDPRFIAFLARMKNQRDYYRALP